MNVFQIQLGITVLLVGPINLRSEVQAFISLEFSSSVPDCPAPRSVGLELLEFLLGSVPALRNAVVGSRIQLLLPEGLTRMSSSPN